jgi:hypothetical protein
MSETTAEQRERINQVARSFARRLLRRAVARRRAVRALLGAGAFGACVGVMTALSTANGTVITLLGLMFALIGGSLVALFKPTEVKPAARRGVFDLAGAISVGLIAGLYLGFATRYVDLQLQLRVAEQYAATRPVTADAATRPAAPVVPPLNAGFPPRFTALQGANATKLAGLLAELDRQLRAGPNDLAPPQRAMLEALRKVVQESRASAAAVEDVAEFLKSPDGARFGLLKDRFDSVYGVPATGPSGPPPQP